MVHHERLPDGRFHILLQGIGRVALDAELPMEQLRYRRVRSRLLTDGNVDNGQTTAIECEVSTLRSCYARLVEVNPQFRDTLGDLPMRISDPCVLADVVNAAVIDDVAARQLVLEEISVCQRLKAANDALATLLLRSFEHDTSLVH